MNASTLTIAKKSKVAHGTIFFYFPQKSDLIISCLYEQIGNLARKLNEKSRESDDIEALCELFLNEISKVKTFYSKLVKELPLLPLDIQRMVFASLSGFSIHLVDVIERLQEKDKIRKFPPKMAMMYWFGLMHYLYSYDELLGTKNFSKDERSEIIKFFINSLRK